MMIEFENEEIYPYVSRLEATDKDECEPRHQRLVCQ